MTSSSKSTITNDNYRIRQNRCSVAKETKRESGKSNKIMKFIVVIINIIFTYI